MHCDCRRWVRLAQCMVEPSQDDLFLDAVDAIVLDALARIGDDLLPVLCACRAVRKRLRPGLESIRQCTGR